MNCKSRIMALVFIGMALGVRSEAAELVTNGNFSAGNTGFASAYNFVVGGSTSPGQYGIVSNPATGFTNGYASYGDHTSGSGLMLLGDGTPGIALWLQTVNVVPNNAYTFSAWVCTPISPFPPVVRFSANGVALGPDFNVSASPGIWQQFTTVYNSGPASTVVLRIEDVRTGAPTGNDLTVDDISLVGPPGLPFVPMVHPIALGGIQLLLVSVAAFVMRRRHSMGPLRAS